MALTDAETAMVYEICQAIVQSNATIHNGYGTLLTLESTTTIKTQIDTYLAALTAAQITRLQTHLTEYANWQHLTATVDSNGVQIDPERQRERLRALIHTYVPVLHIADSLVWRNGPSPGSARPGAVRFIR